MRWVRYALVPARRFDYQAGATSEMGRQFVSEGEGDPHEATFKTAGPFVGCPLLCFSHAGGHNCNVRRHRGSPLMASV